jgi:hypothetical protein
MSDADKQLRQLAKHKDSTVRARASVLGELFSSLESQNQALQERVKAGRMLVESMDRKMGERETNDEDGWITGYQLPVGPWHRLLAWARQGEPARPTQETDPE